MQTNAIKRLKIFLPLIVALAVIVAGVFYVGYRLGTAEPNTILVKGITNIGDDDVTADFGLFWDVWKKLKDEHLHGADVKDQELIYGAIGGMTAALKDPNTAFLPPEDSKKFEEDIKGEFGGIGAEIGIKNDQLVVISPLKGSPAEKTGIKSGDKIIKIDDAFTAGLSVSEAVKKIRGPIGTVVTLSILRGEWKDTKDFEITRQTINVPSLDWEIKDGIMVVKLYNFNEKAALSFYDPGVNALTNRVDGMVLDLRNNPGGYLEIAVHLAGWFLKKGEIVTSEHFRTGPDKVFRANNNSSLSKLPMVVLVNGGSASASEILAGALHDNRGIPIVGEKSFGKGTVQELQPLRDGSQLKITVANWVRPNGEVIDKKGITPDHEVKFTEEDAKKGKDPQMEKAVEVLRGEIIKKKD